MSRLREFAVKLLRSVSRKLSGAEYVGYIPENTFQPAWPRVDLPENPDLARSAQQLRTLYQEIMARLAPITNRITLLESWEIYTSTPPPAQVGEEIQRLKASADVILAEFEDATQEIRNGR